MKAQYRVKNSPLIWLLLVIALVLTACAGLPVSKAPGSKKKSMLVQLGALNGGWILPRSGNVPPFPSQRIGQEYLPLLSPTVVSGNSNYLYIVDSGRRQIYQYDRTQQGMSLFADIPANTVSSISVAPDLSMYVADIASHTVRHFSLVGKLLQTFSNNRELARPVAVIADAASGQVIVADSLYNQLVVFSSLGRLLTVIRSPQTRSISALARGPDGLYLVDRLSRKIVVLGNDGTERYIFGSDTLKDPAAIAVDRYNRVFVSDNFDNTIKVYENGRWRETFGGSGAIPGLFNRSNSLWLDRDILYVADSLNARIQVFRVEPPEAN